MDSASHSAEMESVVATSASTFSDTNLTDYMDVVTTYKCRVCSFTCSHPQGVSSHVRNVHMKATIAPAAPPSAALPTSSAAMDIPSSQSAEQVENCTPKVSIEEDTQKSIKIHSSESSQAVQTFSPAERVSLMDKSQLSTMMGSQTSDQQVIFTQAAVTQPQVIATQSDILTSAGNIVSSYLPMETAVSDGNSITFLSQSALDSQTISHFSVASSDSILSEAQIGTSPVKTKELFLCGQCSIGFDTIEECKNHMVQVHNVLPPSQGSSSNVDSVTRVSVGTQVMSARKKPGRKRKNPAPLRSPSPTSDKDWEEDDSSEWYSRKGRNRRKIRPPKALKEDYYLGKKKKRTKETLMLSEGYNLKCSMQGCFAKFKKEQSLKIHNMCHKKDNDKSYFVCTVCVLEFSLWKHLRMHLWRNHSIDTDLFPCNGCDFRTDTIHKLLVHKEIHGDERPYTCDVCWKGFKQFSQMRNHQMIHVEYQSNEADRWYTTKQCDICKRSFANQKCLNKHIQAVHSKIKPYVCSYCGHSTARKAMLQLHLRIHTGEKPFKCDVCQYATGDHNSLRRHKMRHTGLRPYKCQYCTYSCIQAISLKTHMKNKHPGSSGIYHCDICNYRTVNSTSFSNHVSDHKNGLIDMQEPIASGSETTVNTASPLAVTTAQTTASKSKVKVQRSSDISNTSIQAQLATVENGVTHLSADDIVKIAQAGDGLVSTDLTAAELIYAIAANTAQQDSQVLAGMQGTINISSKQGVSTHTITLHLPPTSQSGVVTGDANSSQPGAAGQTLLMVQPLELCSVNNEGTSQAVSTENIQVSFEQAEGASVMNSEIVMEPNEKTIPDDSL